ncbi:hypothetical protein [Syntrophomonas curvata]
MMKNNEIKILRLIITIIVALGILLGGYNLYQKYMVEKPLNEKLLHMEEVNKVDVNKVNKLYSIQVRLGKVENIQKSYADIDSIIDSSIKGNYAIEIKDGRNQRLGKFFDDLQPALYQGLAQKEFLWLAEQLEQRSQSQNIKSQLRVDNKRVYLQLEDGDSYLYSIIEHTAGAEQEPGRGRDN